VTTVIMRHPTLPPEQEIEVDAGAVPHHAAAGWQPVPSEELEARVAARQAALVAQSEAEPPVENVAAEPEPAEDVEPEKSVETVKPKRRPSATAGE
jgi:hypothetical protein